MKAGKNVFAVLIVLAALAAGLFYYIQQQDHLPAWIAVSNGRIEAQAIDIATRSGGRVVEVAVEEGSMVRAGDVVARIDLAHIAASLAGAEASVRSALQQQEEARSLVAQAESTLTLAEKEYVRTSGLVRQGAVSRSVDDRALNQKQIAEAALAAARQRLAAATETVDVVRAEVARLQDLLSDEYLKATRDGRVLYKLAEPGEVLAAGGKVVTLLDLSDVYMTVFYPTSVVGRLRLGDEARIVLDALPGVAIPARITYISPEAQFTPRQVETRTEREKMTFRVKVRIPASLLRKHIDAVKTGLPGVAYVRTEKDAAWPAFLSVRPDLLDAASGVVEAAQDLPDAEAETSVPEAAGDGQE